MKTARPYRVVRSLEEESPDYSHEYGTGTDRWLLTYSDMITLLLALFVVLYALSSLNHVKYAQFAKGLDSSFNNGKSQPSSSRTRPTPRAGTTQVTTDTASLVVLEQQLRQVLTQAGLIKDVELTIGVRGLIVGLVSDKTFYSIDSAALSPIGVRVVDVAGAVLRRHSNLVNVDGYTDNEPITGGPFESNWQLSAERSVVVVERLQDVARVDPTLLYVVGFGQYHPIVANNSLANQAENRRVDIVISPPGGKVTLP